MFLFFPNGYNRTPSLWKVMRVRTSQVADKVRQCPCVTPFSIGSWYFVNPIVDVRRKCDHSQEEWITLIVIRFGIDSNETICRRVHSFIHLFETLFEEAAIDDFESSPERRESARAFLVVIVIHSHVSMHLITLVFRFLCKSHDFRLSGSTCSRCCATTNITITAAPFARQHDTCRLFRARIRWSTFPHIPSRTTTLYDECTCHLACVCLTFAPFLPSLSIRSSSFLADCFHRNAIVYKQASGSNDRNFTNCFFFFSSSSVPVFPLIE